MARCLPIKIALSCLWRTAAVNAAMTARGMQQLGLVFILAPALRYLYPAPDDLARAFARYNGHTNTHAFMMPSYAGLLLSLETQAAEGRIPQMTVASLRQPLAATLSALGDGFFSGAAHCSWALITICLSLQGMVLQAAFFAMTLILLLLAFRIWSFFYCLRNGKAVLHRLRTLDLVSWTERIKLCNALLITGMLSMLLFEEMENSDAWLKIALILFIPTAAWVVGRLHVSRTLLWIFALGAFVLHEQGYIAF